MRKRPKHLLIELPKAEEIDDLAITTPRLEIRKMEVDHGDAKADLNYAPCKGQVVLTIRGREGTVLVKRHGDKAWSLPSDRIGPNEDIVAAVKRVAEELCGLSIRSAELAGMYDVVWHYSDISIKRLHFVYVAYTDDARCTVHGASRITDARFFAEIPECVQESEVDRCALADCSAK